MKFAVAIEVLEAKQRELDVLLKDETTEPSSKLTLAILHDDLTTAIEALKSASSVYDEYDAALEKIRMWDREEPNVQSGTRIPFRLERMNKPTKSE